MWNTAADRLREMVADGVWQSTFSQVQAIDLDNDTIVLAVPNSIIREKLEGTYRGLVEEAIDLACDSPLTVQFDLRPPTLFDSAMFDAPGVSPSAPTSPAVPGPTDDRVIDITNAAPAPVDKNAPYRPAPSLDGGNRYLFEGFVIGPSNRFAHAAALSVAERPGESYNPLFIYGSAGLGKTHLLRAIEHYVNDVYPDLRVLYISTEQFLNEFVDAIRNSSNNEFKRRYRQIDVLLVDDIQFIAGKDGLQEEFFHTFNELYGSGRQIVLSSDRPPDAIPTLEERLRSRFMMGLLTDIQPPDVETRMAILHKKADRDGYFIPAEVSEFIATNITSNIRELEGALTKVTAYANLNRQPMTRDLAEQTLRDFIADRQPRPITVDMILESTAEQFNFDLAELIGKSRRRPLVEARQIAMYVTRELTDLSFPLIASAFGGRDHTTVMHACEKIGKQMTERSQIFEKVGALERSVRARAAD
ncbi:MAG: chromosomal replication initiator protein DnaA [Acidimicrobiales bacterium]